ncbi:MAG: glycosyltransferase [Bryobacteraceae bacterium]
MNRIGVSVIICCHNSAARLPSTLGHVQAQVGTEGIPWEVIVVDNASTDDTSEVARRVWGTGRSPLLVVKEPRSGLSHARLRGFQESSYEFLSLIDDDNWVAPHWVARTYQIMAKRYDVGACGGHGSAVFDGAVPPAWFEQFSSAYAVGPQGESQGWVNPNRSFLYGAGLTIRRSAFADLVLGGFRPVLSDRRGAALSSGGDSELCHALVLAGWKLWYDPELKFQHFIPESRLHWDYLRALHRGFGAAAAWLELYMWQIVPPRNLEFQKLPLPESWCQAIRKSWLFQLYSTIQTIRRQWRRARGPWRGQQSEGSADVLRMEWELARAIEIFSHPLQYRKARRSIERAKWLRTTGKSGLEQTLARV